MSGSIATPLATASPSPTGWTVPWPPDNSMMASAPPVSYWEQPGSRPVDGARTALPDSLSGNLGGVVPGLLVQAFIALTGLPPQLPGEASFWPEYGAIALMAAFVLALAFGRVGLISLPILAAAVVVPTFIVLPLVAWTFAAGISVRSAGGFGAEAGLGVAISQVFFGLAFFGLSGMLFALSPADRPRA